MASTGSTRTNQENLLRTVYLRDMRRQFNIRSILLQVIGRDSKNFAPGKEISIPLHASAGEGHTWSDAGLLPPASHEKIERATFKYRMMTSRIEIAGDFEDDAASTQASEVRPLDFQIKATIRNGRHDLNFDIYGEGDGVVGSPLSASSGTVFVVDDVRGLRNNMRVDVVLTATGATGSGGVKGAQITVNTSTKTVTLTGGAQLADGTGADLNANFANYRVYRAGARNQAPFGLEAAINTGNPAGGNYGNVDRSLDANDFYRGVVQGNSDVLRGATLKLLQDVVDAIEKKGDGDVNLIICPHDLWSHIADLLTFSKRYQGNMMKLNGWAQAVDFAGIPIVRDKHAHPEKMYCLDTSTWRIYQNNEGSWMDKDGAILSRVPGKVAYEAAWYRRLQLICMLPGGNGILDDLKFVAAS